METKKEKAEKIARRMAENDAAREAGKWAKWATEYAREVYARERYTSLYRMNILGK